MPVLTEATILKREAQAVEVMALSFRGGLTQEAACEEVGISEDVYRDWIRKSPILVTSLRDFIDGAHREALTYLSQVRLQAIEMFISILLDDETEPKDKLGIWRQLKLELEELERVYHAAPGVEQDAHQFLKEGPKIKDQESRLTVTLEGGGILDVSVSGKQQDVVDAEFYETKELQESLE